MAKNTSDDRNFSGMKAIEEKNIYANVEDKTDNVCRRTEDSDTTRNKTFHHTGSERVMNRSNRSVTVCLVLLCVLLLTAVIVLCVLINTNNQQFNTNNKNITEEREQLLTKFINITEERDQLLTKYTNITEERDKFIAKYNNITKLSEQWIQTINGLLTGLYDGWINYKSSLYFISSEQKTWSDSRRYCRERGADLIIINNEEEQDFFKNRFGTDLIWIGLSDIDEEDRWKWVDGSTLTTSFWDIQNEPNGGRAENCALSYAPGWADYPCANTFKWICEKTFFNKL